MVTRSLFIILGLVGRGVYDIVAVNHELHVMIQSVT